MGALYRLNTEWRLLAGIHKGYNPPAPGSTAAEESSLNIEFGARFDNGALSFESIYFINDYHNLVGTVSDSTGGGGEVGDQYDGGEVVVSGLELSTGYSWDFGRLSMPVNLEYTWTDKAEFQSSFESGFDPWGDVQSGDELPYIPEHQLRVSGGLVTEKWRVNVGASYIGDLRTKAGQGAFVASESIDAHVVWDAVAAWNFTPNLSTYFKVNNLFDETYMAARRPAGVRPGLPRTAFVGLAYRL
jgi:Fe(3+) dicitrate transport protein